MKLLSLASGIITLLYVSSCGMNTKNQESSTQSATQSSQQAPTPKKEVALGSLFGLTDAEKILGEAAHFTDSSSSTSARGTTYQSAYEANEKDGKSKKTGNVYFLVTRFENPDSAKQEYHSIMEANRKNGIEELNGLGDEAYFHTDNENFYFIMVVKGKMSFRIKVNKLTSKTSRTEFDAVAQKITDKL